MLVIAASQSPIEDAANSPRTTQGTSPAQILIHPYQSKERLNTVKALWIIRVALRISRSDPPLRFSITLLSLSDHSPLVDTMSKRARESEGGSAILACRTLQPVVFTHSSKEVRAAVTYRDCNEVDEVDRLQLGGAGCGHCSTRPA